MLDLLTQWEYNESITRMGSDNVANRILELREKYNLTRVDIEKKYSIPQRTLYNWETEIRKCPDYVFNLLEKAMICDYEKSDSLKKIEIFFESRKEPEKDMEAALRAIKYMEYLTKQNKD